MAHNVSMTSDKKSSVDQILSETASKASKILRETFATPKVRESEKQNLAIIEEKLMVSEILKKQKDFFDSGATLDIEFRKEQLKKLYDAIIKNQKEIEIALRGDLFKNPFESYATEIGVCLSEITLAIKKLKKWSKPKVKGLELVAFPAVSKLYPQPYGTVLIISPWNYPFLLSFGPLIHAIAAGNTALVKTSSQSPESSALIKKIIGEAFDQKYIAVHDGGDVGNSAVLEQKYDMIFFTGSTKVGQLVMESASRTLTPVVLELGGKNPCIVDCTANLENAARRIIWGKLLNAGQTCVAPDYLLVPSSIKDKFMIMLDQEIKNQYGNNPIRDDDYPKIVNTHHFNRLKELCPEVECDTVSNKIAPTVKYLGVMGQSAVEDSLLMDGEIFGPILPVISYDSLDDVVRYINKKPNPLALYVFTSNKEVEKLFIQKVRYGGGCINDCIVHVASNKIPFGGFGLSDLAVSS